MDSVKAEEASTLYHVVAMPYPGRSHINATMNLCKILASKTNETINIDIIVTFVVTEEWLGFIGAEPKPDNIRFATVPNVVPSELVRAADHNSFFEATMTKLEAPFECLLDRLEPPATVILAETFFVLGGWCWEAEEYSVGVVLANGCVDVPGVPPFQSFVSEWSLSVWRISKWR